ncbi:MAG: hypothetical protein MHM6MM_001960 [Cercozoa sp. M6MM]
MQGLQQALRGAAKPSVMSGIQPTGVMHLGNYYGAVRNWVEMQRVMSADYPDSTELYLSVVDLHAWSATTVPRPAEVRNATMRTAALVLAAGIDPDKSTLFLQSHVPAHSELSWLLQCFSPHKSLMHMPQFNEKSAKHQPKHGMKRQTRVSSALLTYPVLQAADILLYDATHVPVGEDQIPHIDLTRDLAVRINSFAEQCDRFDDRADGPPHLLLDMEKQDPVFVVPEAVVLGDARIMSLQNGGSKMSKTDPSIKATITLLDDDDTIAKKIRKAKTDFDMTVRYDRANAPEVSNLVNMLHYASGMPIDDIVGTYETMEPEMRYRALKADLIDAILAELRPLRQRYTELYNDPAYLQQALQKGQHAACEKAETTLARVRDALGLVPSADFLHTPV